MPERTAVGSVPPAAPSAREALWARRPMSGTVIDAHAHVGGYGLFWVPRPGADDMVSVMDRCGVRWSVVSSNRAIAEDAGAGNREMIAAVERHLERLAGYVVANPQQRPLDELNRWHQHPNVVGIKLHAALHGEALDGKGYHEVWEFAEEHDLPVLAHTEQGSWHSSPAQVAEVCRRYPGVRVLAGHAGGTPTGFAEAIELAREHPNVVLEICGTYMTSWWLKALVEAVGADRVAFGSDFVFIDMRYSLGRVVLADLPEEDIAMVLGGTSARLFGLL